MDPLSQKSGSPVGESATVRFVTLATYSLQSNYVEPKLTTIHAQVV